MQVIIPYAGTQSLHSDKQVSDIHLPNLNRLLARMYLSHSDTGSAESYSPPHERALARLHGLPSTDGYIPWAAEHAVSLGLPKALTTAWCFVTLCHCTVGLNDVQLQNPDLLQVTESESHTLLNDMQAYFAEDGLALYALADIPHTWLVCGEPLRGMRSVSLDRVIGKNINQWQATGNIITKLHRLQNEMQMLLYTHCVNTARDRSKTANINSLWFHGSGELAAAQTSIANTKVLAPRNLADAVFSGDAQAWVVAWNELDASVCADLLNRVNADEPITLTLCGEQNAISYALRPNSIMNQIRNISISVFGLKSAYSLPKVLFNL